MWGLLTRGFSTLAGGARSCFLPRHPPQPARPVSASQTSSANGSLYFPAPFLRGSQQRSCEGAAKAPAELRKPVQSQKHSSISAPAARAPAAPSAAERRFPCTANNPGHSLELSCTVSNRMGDAAAVWQRGLPRGNLIILFLIELQRQHRARKGGHGQAI